MASPMVESRIEPHKKAHYSLHISDRITNSDSSHRGYSSVKYNHKPAQTSDSRTTKLTSASPNTYNLKVEDRTGSRDKDIFTFTGNRVAAKKSYVLLFDPASQKATLEPLSDAYTFNIATKNDKNISSEYSKIYPKKNKESQQDDEGGGDLFGEVVADDESGDPDSNNPYDFRHFLDKEKEKRSDDSEYHASSPEYRTGTGSAMNTPQFGARKTAETSVAKAKVAEPVQKKRKTVDPFMKKKAGVKKAQPTPSIHLERKATERPPPAAAPKSKAKAAAPPSSKIKSAELVHSSDESDADAEGEPEPVSSPPRQSRRSPSPQYHASPDAEDEDAEGESDDDGDFEIEIPDARPSRPQNNAGGSLKNLGLGQNLGLGGRGLKSPSQGPISLASAASSAHGSPNPQTFTSRKSREDDNVIDFGDIEEDAEGEDDEEEDDGGYELEIDEGEGDGDRDVEVIDIGPPARQGTSGHERKQSIGGPAGGGAAAEDDEEDPLYQEMMAGLAGDSSEESEEE